MIAANGRRLFAFLDEGVDENWAIAAQWGTASVVVAVGIVGLLRDSGTKSIPESWLNVHALFGLLLCVSVTARFYWEMKHPTLVPSIDIDLFTRHVSRMVYLLLYGLLGAKQIIDIATFLWHGGGLDFGWFQADSVLVHPRTILKPIEDFQVYVAYGILALMLNQALAAVWRHTRQTRVDSAKETVTAENVDALTLPFLHRPEPERTRSVLIAPMTDLGSRNGGAHTRAQ